MYKEKDNSLLCASQFPSMPSQSQADGDCGLVTATGGIEDIGVHFSSSQVSVGMPASQNFLVSVSPSFDFLVRVRRGGDSSSFLPTGARPNGSFPIE